LELLKVNPMGLTVSDISKNLGYNRNSAAKHLEILHAEGRVDLRAIGTAKVYSLTQRVPLSAFLCFTKNMILVVDTDLTVIQGNSQYLKFAGFTKQDLLGMSIEDTELPIVSSPEALAIIRSTGKEQVITDVSYVRGKDELYYQMEVIPTMFEGGGTGLTIVLEDITERKKYVKNMEFLARTAIRFVDLADDDNIYRFIAEQVRKILPDSIVTINSYDTESQELSVRAIAADKGDIDIVQAEFNPHLEEMSFPFRVEPMADSLLRMQGLVEGPSFYHILFQQYPEELCDRVEERLKVDKKTYVMGFTCRGGVFGNVLVKMKKGARIENIELLEAFINQASVALLRRYARKELRNNEEQHIRQMEFLTRTAMELVDMGEEEDIYRYIAEKVYGLLPCCFVAVTSFDMARKTTMIRYLAAPPDILEYSGEIGVNPVGMTFPMGSVVDIQSILSKKRLIEGPGLYHLLSRQVPEDVCSLIEEKINFGRSYAMGFVHRGEIIGSVGIGIRKGEALENRELVEAFIGQAAVALMRRQKR
ncbi:MAG: PAS domain S-box protein, partial [Methanoregulaceae archaeon]|nr:PAS domain S-box protein [Methanoregulaceae archaeon]